GGGAGPGGMAPPVPSLGEDEQRRAGLLTGWAGGWRAAGLAGPGDEQADPAGAGLVLDRLGDAEGGQPAAALEPAVELPGALLLDAAGGPHGHERSAGDEADEQADDDRRGHRLPLRMLRSSTLIRSTASEPMTVRRPEPK